MRTTNLDLGLAIAAVLRGYIVRRKDNPNISLMLGYGKPIVVRDKGKNLDLSKSVMPFNWKEQIWYIAGDDASWLSKEVKSHKQTYLKVGE